MFHLRPIDTSTEEAISRERYRRAHWTTVASIIAKGTVLLVTFITIRVMFRYLGGEQYGLWVVLASFTVVFSYLDLGIGNALLNSFSEARSQGDQKTVQALVSNAFFLLVGFGLILGVGFLVAYSLIPWDVVFNTSSLELLRVAGPAAAILISCLLVNLPLFLSTRIQLGTQHGFRNSLWEILGQAVGLAAILTVVHFRGDLVWLALATGSGFLIASLGNALSLFWSTDHSLRPALHHVELTTITKLLKTGLIYLLLQLAAILMVAVDTLIAAQVLGPAAAAQYAIPMRLFSALLSISSLYALPLWPAYCEALAKGERLWARQAVIRSVSIVTMFSVLPAIFLVIGGRSILTYWVGPEIQPSLSLLLSLALWTVMAALSTAFSMFLNAHKKLRIQVYCAVVTAIVSFGLRIVLARHYGLAGIGWGLVIPYALITFIPLSLVTRQLTQELGRTDPARNGSSEAGTSYRPGTTPA